RSAGMTDRGVSVPSRLPHHRPRSRALSPQIRRGTWRLARRGQRAAQRGFILHRLQTCWPVATPPRHTQGTVLDRGDGPMAQKGRGIFLVYVDIDAEHDKEFNDWYNTEHLPELLSVPGILAAARYQAVTGGPKYLAFYELDNVAVMHTPAFTNRP